MRLGPLPDAAGPRFSGPLARYKTPRLPPLPSILLPILFSYKLSRGLAGCLRAHSSPRAASSRRPRVRSAVAPSDRPTVDDAYALRAGACARTLRSLSRRTPLPSSGMALRRRQPPLPPILTDSATRSVALPHGNDQIPPRKQLHSTLRPTFPIDTTAGRLCDSTPFATPGCVMPRSCYVRSMYLKWRGGTMRRTRWQALSSISPCGRDACS